MVSNNSIFCKRLIDGMSKSRLFFIHVIVFCMKYNPLNKKA